MRLPEALMQIGYESEWAIWAELIEGQLTTESEARFGQTVFDNGGILDDWVFVCDGIQIGDFLSEWEDDEGDLIYGWFDEFIDPINGEI